MRQTHVHGGAGHEGGERLEAFEGLEEERRGASAPHRRECDADASVGAAAEAVLGERGAEERAGELLEAGASVRGHPDVGVEGEAVDLGSRVTWPSKITAFTEFMVDALLVWW